MLGYFARAEENDRYIEAILIAQRGIGVDIHLAQDYSRGM